MKRSLAIRDKLLGCGDGAPLVCHLVTSTDRVGAAAHPPACCRPRPDALVVVSVFANVAARSPRLGPSRAGRPESPRLDPLRRYSLQSLTASAAPGPPTTIRRQHQHEQARSTGRRRLGRRARRATTTSCSSRSTRTPPPTTRATSRARSSSTGRRTCRTRSAATSSTRSSSRSCCPSAASATTTPSCSTAATTTGSRPTPTGTSSSTATQNVALLDGGRKKWELDSRELSSETSTATGDVATPPPEQDLDIRAFRDEVVAAIGSKNLVDVRSPDEYAGRLLAPAHLPQEQAQRGGHIPTAVERPVEQGGQRRRHVQVRRRAQEALRRRRASTWDKDTIAYCRIGERSAHTWFVLHEILGQPNVKNYDGSWTEYGSLVGVPVALGDEPGDA